MVPVPMPIHAGAGARCYLRDATPEERARELLAGVIAGVVHMHSRGVAHRDLKLDNMLLTEAGDVRIDTVYTSVLGRALRTAGLCVEALRRNGRPPPPILPTWRLNERHYGMLQPQPHP